MAEESDGTRYRVGYGKPPLHSQFRKGQSGNPRGRPKGSFGNGRANALALKEAYRPVTVKEGDRTLTLPAIQAVMRSQVALAAKGNGPAQRTVVQTIQAIERQIEANPPEGRTSLDSSKLSDVEVARHIAFMLAKAARS
jgi:hypothetical protein